MNVQALVDEFLQSSHGQNAAAAVSAQGFSADDTANILAEATKAAHAHAEETAQSGGLLGDNPGKSFFAAFAAGLVKGDGLVGALEDGGEGVIVARVTQAIADKCGLDSSTAQAVAAAATPYVVGFLKQKLRG